MLRRATIVATLLMVGLAPGWAAPVAAQDPSAPAATAAPAEPGTPTAVHYVDAQGVDHGTVTIRSMADPFTEFDPNYPPAEDQRYVLLTVIFEAAETQSFYADPYAIKLQTSDGWLYSPANVPRPQPVAIPDFQSQTLSPFDRVSGAIGYVVPAAATIASVQYIPENARLIPLQSAVTGPGPAAGTAVTYVSADGVTHGTVTVKVVADPFTEFDPNRPPAEGQRYVLLTVVFEAAEDQAMWADPYAIDLQDANGYLIKPSGVPRPPENVVPDLQSQTLSPMDRISGYVGYVIGEATELKAVLYEPEGGRLIPLVDLAAGS